MTLIGHFCRSSAESVSSRSVDRRRALNQIKSFDLLLRAMCVSRRTTAQLTVCLRLSMY